MPKGVEHSITAYIALGSNQGDRRRCLDHLLAKISPIVSRTARLAEEGVGELMERRTKEEGHGESEHA